MTLCTPLEVQNMMDLGYAVLPIHGISDSKTCTCGKAECGSPGKHPRTRSGAKEASTDPDQVDQWLQRFGPRTNWAVSTDNLIVVDIDPRHSGDKSFEELIGRNGSFPETLTTQTSGGGRHYYFRRPANCLVRNGSSSLMPGIDHKTNGGYVLIPPSKHVSGADYIFEDPSAAIAELPNWLLELLEAPTRNPKSTEAARANAEFMTEGNRNTDLTSMAGFARRKGMAPADIFELLLLTNSQSNSPLCENEVAQIAHGISRYAVPPNYDAEPLPLAAQLTADLGQKIRYTEGLGWFVWNGCRWVNDPQRRHLLHEVRKCIERYVEELEGYAAEINNARP